MLSGRSPEHLRALRVERAVGDQVVDVSAGLEVRIELDERGRPEVVRSIGGIDFAGDVADAGPGEASAKPLVLGDEFLSEGEYVHQRLPAPAELACASIARCHFRGRPACGARGPRSDLRATRGGHCRGMGGRESRRARRAMGGDGDAAGVPGARRRGRGDRRWADRGAPHVARLHLSRGGGGACRRGVQASLVRRV